MRIYHLLSAGHAVNNIALKRIKVARYADLNDPFELLAGELSNRNLRRAVSALKMEFHKSRGLLCFSRSWRNPVLWSHYGDKHHGVALGFDVDNEFGALINYSDKRLAAKFRKGTRDNELDPEFVKDLIYTKYIHWEYEEEFRLHVDLDKAQKEGGLFFTEFEDIGIELKEVILGHSCRVPIEKIRKLVSANYEKIDVIKARLGFREFEVVVDQRSVQ